MEQKFDIGLNAKITEFSKKFNIIRTNDNDNNVFEEFGNYVISSVLLEEEMENIASISTNKAEGIDGIVMIINNHLISEESDLNKLGESEQLLLKIGFIQSTTQKSFDEQKLSAFTDTVVKFLTGDKNIEPFSTIYNKLLNEDCSYISRMIDTPEVSLHFLSARTSHIIADEKINAEKQKITLRTDITNKCKVNDFKIYQTEEIKKEYDKIIKFHTVKMKFEKNIRLDNENTNIEMSLLASIKFSELKKLILTSDNNLKERLFIENVRNYIGNTPVNIDIEKTLNDEKQRIYFPYLNNGITIMCSKITQEPVANNTFNLTFPRIINGCQTTNALYNKFKNTSFSNEIDNVEIIAKIISTNDNELKKSIIYAANNQNAIDKDLQSLNDFHEKIETYFIGKDITPKLYYERLRGQHSNITPPYCKINIETIARVYISVFLKEPEKMKGYALSKIETYQKERKIFNNNDAIADYFYCALLYYWLNHFILNRYITLRSKTMDMHLLMSVNLKLINRNIITTENKIDYISVENNAKDIFKTTCEYLNNTDFLFERRGFYSAPKTRQLIESLNNANTSSEN